MTRDDWDGLIGADRWWHLEYGLVIFGRLLKWWRDGRGRCRLAIDVPDGNLRLEIRGEGITKLTIGGPND